MTSRLSLLLCFSDKCGLLNRNRLCFSYISNVLSRNRLCFSYISYVLSSNWLCFSDISILVLNWSCGSDHIGLTSWRLIYSKWIHKYEVVVG